MGHSELNAIELIWAQVKNEVARKNVSFKISDVKELMHQALNNVSSENWRKAVTHVQEVEAAFRRVDFGEEDGEIEVEQLIIELTQSDFESDASTDSDDENDF